MNNKYDIYQIDAQPVPLMNNESKYDIGYTILDTETTPDFFVLTSDNQFFTELTTAQYLYCVSLQDTTCPLLTTIYASLKGSCAGALHFNRNEEVARLCTFIIYPNKAMHDQITYISHSTYLVSAPQNEYTIQCPGMAQQQYHGRYNLVSVPCACAVNTEKLRLPPSLAACNDKKHEVVISFPKNTVQLQLFEIKEMELNVPDVNPPQFTVPKKFESVNLQEYKHIDDTFKVDMQRAVLISGGDTIHLKKIKPIQTQSNFIDWTTILIYVSLAVSVANMILVVILTIKAPYKIKCILASTNSPKPTITEQTSKRI